jgi:hypothetical protein
MSQRPLIGCPPNCVPNGKKPSFLFVLQFGGHLIGCLHDCVLFNQKKTISLFFVIFFYKTFF